MDKKQELMNAFLVELDRVIGSAEETRFYTTNGDAANLAEHVATLRQMPSGIGYDEMLRRLGVPPLDTPPGGAGTAQ